MTDYHFHIGQFNEVYYDALEAFALVERISSQTEITEIRYASTSSCRDDVELSGIEEEIAYAQHFESKTLKTSPYLWFIPKYAEQGISIESATKAFDYCGIKLHPAAQDWDETNPAHSKALHSIFRWADENGKSVLIHCGTQKCDSPTRFESLFLEYTNANVILAHSTPLIETAEMVNKYENVFCDTACIDEESLKKLKMLVQNDAKVLFGSDFPVTHYFSTHLFGKTHSLEEEYLLNCSVFLRKI